MKILVLGGNGMLGHKLIQALKNDFDVFTTVRSNVNIQQLKFFIDKKFIFENVEAENFVTVRDVIEFLKPDVIINCIGIIKQKDESKYLVKTLTVNSIFPHLLQEVSIRNNARLITISTDCVFAGRKGMYSESDLPDAADLYGKSKNLGELTEKNSLTLRTSIIGRELVTNYSLVEWFLSNKGGRVQGFSKALYSGFPTIVLADIIKNLIEKHSQLSGLYHVSSEPINKFELLGLIKGAYKLDIQIDFEDKFEIDRSLDSEKFRKAVGFRPMPWTKMISLMAQDPTPYQQIRSDLARNNK